MTEFVKPSVEYFELWPLLVVFGVACLGVVVEAFAPRAARYTAQVVLALARLVAALVGVVLVARDVKSYDDGAARGVLAVGGTVAVDGPSLFIWGLVLALAIGGVLLFAERHLDGGASAFAGQAAAVPGTDAETAAISAHREHTEVYPLLMFAVFGMMLFPAANDLLTMFVGLEVLSLPLYLLSGLARRRRLLSQEAALKYFLLGAFSSGFFLYGAALTTATPARWTSPRSTRRSATTSAAAPAPHRHRTAVGRPALQGRAVRSRRGPPTSTRAPRPR